MRPRRCSKSLISSAARATGPSSLRRSSDLNLSLALLAWASMRRTVGDHINAAQALLEVLDLLSGSGNRSQLSETFLRSEPEPRSAGVGEHEANCRGSHQCGPGVARSP